jgi:hypothetical protein
LGWWRSGGFAFGLVALAGVMAFSAVAKPIAQSHLRGHSKEEVRQIGRTGGFSRRFGRKTRKKV